MAVNKERKKATVKLIPRIDLQALAAKFVTIFNLYHNPSFYHFLLMVIVLTVTICHKLVKISLSYV